MYNEAVDHYNNTASEERKSWMELAKDTIHSHDEKYIKDVPFQIKKIAFKDAKTAISTNLKKSRETHKAFTLRFKTRKNPSQSCYIPKSALCEHGIYHTIAGSLKMKEHHLLENGYKDLRLLCENGRWYLCVPVTVNKTPYENQDGVVAIDPGIRTFATYFTTDGRFGWLGSRDFQRILNLNLRIDKLVSKIATEKDKHRKHNLKRACNRVRWRISDLVDELHWQIINDMVRRYKVVVFPPYNVSEMVKKGHRKIKKVVVRSMLSFRFHEFKERLKLKCLENGVVFIEQNEAWTSKTNSFSGDLMLKLGSREWFKYEGVKVNRDLNGARNILIRALRDSSATAEMLSSISGMATTSKK